MKVTLGMAVYNAEDYLEKALTDVLSQSYTDFELIISDNASSDGSSKIYERFMEKDERIVGGRYGTNHGAIFNFNGLLEDAVTEYFAWISDHDLRHKDWLKRCVECLDENKDVVLVQSKMLRYLFGGGVRNEPGDLDTRGLKPLDRFVKGAQTGACGIFYGLYRTEKLKECKSRNAKILGADHVILTEMALKGEFATIPEILFYRVENRRREKEPDRRKRVMEYINPLETRVFTNEDVYKDFKIEFYKVIGDSGLTEDEKEAARRFIVWEYGNRYGIRQEMR